MQHKNKDLVGAEGLEPSSPKAADFKSAAYANSATLPWCYLRYSFDIITNN